MAKDTEEQYCDLEQSLPKTTIHKRHISNGYTTNLKNNNHFKTDKNGSIVIDDDDDDDDVVVEESSSTIQFKLEENGLPPNNINMSNGAFQLAVLREVECSMKENDKIIEVENVVNEVKRRRGRPKGCILKKKETLSEEMHVDNDDGSEKKGFSLRLDFLGRYQKHKPKLKKDKSARNSIEDNSPTPKRKCGRPLNISKDYILDDSYLNNLGIEGTDNSEVNTSSRKKKSENGLPNQNDLYDTDNENKDKDSISSSQTNEKIINVKPISLEPRRRIGRPKGPPKPPKTGKRGRKPNPNKSPKPLKQSKSEDENNESKIQKIPGKRGRPKLYHDRPPKIKVPGRKVGRPLGPPKPFKPKGPRGRPRLIRINTSDRPPYNPMYNTFIKSEDANQKLENNIDQNIEYNSEIKLEHKIKIKFRTSSVAAIKNKRGRPIGYSPIGKTQKRLGRPPAKTKAALLRKMNKISKTGRGRGRPRKVYNFTTTKNNEIIDQQNQPITNDEPSIKSEIPIEIDDDGSDIISVTDKNWETIVEDSDSNSKIDLDSDNDSGDDKKDSDGNDVDDDDDDDSSDSDSSSSSDISNTANQ